ncbi:MAG: hypothetical protein ACJAWO_000939 [Halieaceae bacterium]|jgi:hypothetical protein
MKKFTLLMAFVMTLFVIPTAFAQTGSTFTNSLSIASLPNVLTGETTCGFGNNYTISDIACSGSYLSGDEKIYSFTPSSNITDFNVELTNIGTSWSGMFITDDSTSSGNCLGSVGTSGTATKGVYGVSLVSGTTYYIIVSTYETPQCIASYDINMYEITCPQPNALGVSNTTTTSVTLDWTEAGTATAWELEWHTAGFTLGAGSTVTPTSNSTGLTGLSANTAYDFYVRSGCSLTDSSIWSGPFSFTTSCSVFTPDYTETFATFVPGCWDVADAGSIATGPSSFGASPWSSSSSIGNTVSINLYTSSRSDWVLSPFFDLSVGGYEVSIDVAVTNWNSSAADAMGSDDSVRLAYSDDGITWNTLVTWTVADALSNTLNSIVVAVPSTGTNVQFGILATDGPVDDLADYDFHIDNFVVRTPPSCFAVSSLTATNLSPTSADLGWTENGTATTWDIEWGTAGFTQGSGTIITGTTTNPNSLSGLTANTSYEYYVRADCGSASSAWVGPYSFFTGHCIPSPSSVDGIGITNVSMDTLNNSTGSETNNYGDYSAMIANAGQQTNLSISVTLETGYSYNVWAFVDWNNDLDFDDASEQVYLGESTSANPYTLNATLAIPYNASLGNHRLRIGGADNGLGNIAPSSPCYSGSYGSFEDYTLNVTAGPSCFAPDSLMAMNLLYNSADLSFVELGSATAWEVEWDTIGFTMGNGTTVSATSIPLSISSLTAETGYEFYVRSVCGPGDSSLWVGPYSFITPPSCPAPDTLLTSNVTNSTADLSWIEMGAATNWEVEIDTAGFGLGTGARNAVTANSYSVTSLASNAMYEFYVRSVCGSGDSSVWVGPISFQTNLDVITSFPYLNGFENGLDTYLGLSDSAESNASINALAANGTGFGVLLTGNSSIDFVGGSNSATENEAFVTNSSHVSSIIMQVDAAGQTGLVLEFDMKQTYTFGPNYSWGRVLINGMIVGSAFNPTTAGSDAFETISIDLSAYSGTQFTVEIQHSGKYNLANGSGGNGDEAFIDNVKIFEPMTSTMAGTNLNCNNAGDGSATITVADGYPTYSYLWSNGDTTAMADSLSAGVHYVTVTGSFGLMLNDTVTLTEPAALTLALGNDTTVCLNASLTLDAGIFASYLWNDGTTMQTRATVNNAVATTSYSVTVTAANGCTAIDMLDVSVAAQPVVTLGNDTVVCDSLTLSLDAGTFASYVWDDASTIQTRMTAYTLGAIDYSVEVTDANGCTGNDTIQVTGVAPVMVDLGSDTVVCNGDVYTLDAGTFASYLWDDTSNTQTRITVSTLGAVDYSVAVTDASGCVGNDTIEVTGVAPIVINLGSDTVVCNGDTYTLDAGAGFTTYFWVNGFNTQTVDVVSSSAGTVTYSVIVEDTNGCAGADEAIITTKDPVLVDLGPDTNIWQAGTTEITLNAGTGFTSYLWSDNMTTSQTYVVQQSNSGSVSVVVEDADGCEGMDTTVVKFVLGVDEFNASALKMYPNPAVDQVTVELSNFGSANNVDVTFMTITGQVVMSERINVSGNSYTETFDVSALATGTYLVKFDVNGETVIRQFVIK